MRELQENKQVVDAQDRYIECWYEKFGRSPIFGKLDFEALRWVVQRVGRDETLDALKHYFTMTEDWFIKRAYSVGAFKDNLNLILADMSKADKRARISLKNRPSALDVDRILLRIEPEESRRRLNLEPDGMDDWQIEPPYTLPPEQFKQWKELRNWDLEKSKQHVKSALKTFGTQSEARSNDLQSQFLSEDTED